MPDERQWGAMEGTGFGLLAAGAILAMAWLGELFGSVSPVGIGRFAALFSAVGIAVLAWALSRQ